jgi:hypothetical protein
LTALIRPRGLQDDRKSNKRIGFQLEPGDDEIDGLPVKSDYNRPGDHKVRFTKFIKM